MCDIGPMIYNMVLLPMNKDGKKKPVEVIC